MPTFNDTTRHTARLRLRPLVPADAGALLTIFSDPEVMRYWSSTPWTGIEQADQYIASATEDIARGSGLRFGIEVEANGHLIGQVALYNIHTINRRCEVGYALARAHWGKGYLSEALGEVLGYGFKELNLHRVEADIDPRNAASARALERHGFQREGLLRERWIVGGEVCDTAFYGLLRRDWEALASR